MIRSLLPLVAIATPVIAAPFDGTWKVNVATAKLPTKPDVFTLKDGVYGCASCTPAWAVKADGAFHPIAGHAFTDAVAIRIVDARTVEEQDRLKGKVTSKGVSKIAADGKTLTYSWADMSAPSGQVATGEVWQSRVGAAPAGQHAIAGSWRTTKIGGISEQALTGTYMQHGNSVMFKTPDGFGWTAELGGKPVAMTGNPASQTIAVKAIPGGLEETRYDSGKVSGIRTMTAAPGGKTLHVVAQDKKQGTTTTYEMHKVG